MKASFFSANIQSSSENFYSKSLTSDDSKSYEYTYPESSEENTSGSVPESSEERYSGSEQSGPCCSVKGVFASIILPGMASISQTGVILAAALKKEVQSVRGSRSP